VIPSISHKPELQALTRACTAHTFDPQAFRIAANLIFTPFKKRLANLALKFELGLDPQKPARWTEKSCSSLWCSTEC
jgi:hypothetical protein